jgi:hypothetical protein
MSQRESEAGSARAPQWASSSPANSGMVMSFFSAKRERRNARCGSSLAWRRPPTDSWLYTEFLDATRIFQRVFGRWALPLAADAHFSEGILNKRPDPTKRRRCGAPLPLGRREK